ncbi:MAG: tyrosine-type recombinase/integrase [Devosia sp.]
MTARLIKNSWWVDFRADYVRYRKRSPQNSKAGAQAYEAVLRQRLARGGALDGKLGLERNPPFREFAWTWFDDYVVPNNKFSEQRAKRGVLNRHLIPFFGGVPIGSISTHLVEQFKAKQLKSGATSSSLRNRLTILSKCLNCARDWLELETPPPKIRLPRLPPVRTDYLSGDECEALLAAADGVIYEMILTTLCTGMRQGEIKGLQWPSIDWQNRSVLVQHSQCDVRKILDTPKNGRARHIPLDTNVLALLHKRKQTSGYVFLNNGKPFHCKPLNLALAAVCKKAGIRRTTWHVMRHTFATNVAMRGVPLQIVQRLLGHSTVTTTERYAHVAPSMLRAAIDMLNPQTQPLLTFGQPVGNQWNAISAERGKCPSGTTQDRVRT